MKKQKVYLDTTVPSAFFDARAPDRAQLTKTFWLDRLPDFDPVISKIVLSEIHDTPNEEKREKSRRVV